MILRFNEEIPSASRRLPFLVEKAITAPVNRSPPMARNLQGKFRCMKPANSKMPAKARSASLIRPGFCLILELVGRILSGIISALSPG
jgi:hypothetical protein